MNNLTFRILCIILVIFIWVNDKNTQQENSFKETLSKNYILAKQGDIKSMVYLADFYRIGKNTLFYNDIFNTAYGRNLYNSAYWYEQAALKGDAYAQLKIADIYQNGIAVEKNLQNANYWYHQSAIQGEVFAQMQFAKNLEKGIGIKQNYNEAMYWYLQAANQGYSDAIYKIGVIYDDGLWGFPEDDKKALFWLQKIRKDPNDHSGNFTINQDVFHRLLQLENPIDLSSLSPPTHTPKQQFNSNNKIYSSDYYGHSEDPTAQCWDGSYSYSLGRRGVCSHHGGVKYWF